MKIWDTNELCVSECLSGREGLEEGGGGGEDEGKRVYVLVLVQ